MTLQAWSAYAATVLVLMVVPGPSHLLMLSNSLAAGFRPSLATAAGDLSANLLQMIAAGLGLAALVHVSAPAFAFVKWLGVAYLIWLGLRMMLTRTDAAPESSSNRRRLWIQGFVTSAANPKAVVFFAALFPQFIRPDLELLPQLAVLSVTYLAIDGVFLLAYGAGAAWFQRHMRARSVAGLQRLGGVLLIVAAVLLGTRTVRA